jgi:hypothetical protein
MKRHPFAVLVFLAAIAWVRAQDVTGYALGKERQYEQTSASAPALASRPYQFFTYLETGAGGLMGGTVTTPGAAVLNLSPEGPAAWGTGQSYLSQGGLDGDFPSGAYALKLDTVDDGTKTIMLSLSGDTYPPAPQILNFPAAQTVNPAADFTVVWSVPGGIDVNDFAQLQVFDTNGFTVFATPSFPTASNAANASAGSVIIPAGTFNTNQTYIATLLFGHASSVDSTSYGQGVVGYAVYAAQTQFTLTTAGVPDASQLILAKVGSYMQTTSAAPANNGYSLIAQVGDHDHGVNGAGLLLQGGASLALAYNGDQYELSDSYLSSAGLNADFPDGSYTFIVHGVHDGIRTVPLSLTGGGYPNVPQVQNFADAQAVNPSAPFTVVWSAAAGGASADYVSFQLQDGSGNTVVQSPELGRPDALTGGAASSFTIPANTLNPYTTYKGRLLFAHFSQVNTTSYGQGVTGYAGYAVQMQFSLVTAGTPDVTQLLVAKGIGYQQSGSSAPTLVSQPYLFMANVNESSELSNTISGANLLLPGGSSQSLAPGQGKFKLKGAYISEAGLNADFPDGTYTFTVHAIHDGQRTVPIQLTGDGYPNAPQILNFGAAQGVDPTTPFTVSWNSFAGGIATDYVSFQVMDGNGNTVVGTPGLGQPGALTGLSPASFTIPANTLNTNTAYTCQVIFAHIAQVNTTAYGQGVPAYAAYFAQIKVPLATVAPAAPPDVQRFGLVKGVEYRQTSPAAPSLVDGSPYVFNAFADSNGGLLLGGSLTLPNATVRQFVATNGNSPSLEGVFPTQAALDAAFPPGTYTVTLVTQNNGTQNSQLPLPAGAFPGAPEVLNFAACQAVDPHSNFTVNWSPFSGGRAGDYIQFDVETADGRNTLFQTPPPGQPGALNGTSTSAVIPAGTLATGETYTMRVLFATFLGESTNYTQGFSAYYSQTQATLTTTGVAVIPTLTLVSAGPNQWRLHANGAINQNYVIQFTTSLASPINWQGMVNFMGSPSGFDFVDGMVRPQNFYRVIQN